MNYQFNFHFDSNFWIDFFSKTYLPSSTVKQKLSSYCGSAALLQVAVAKLSFLTVTGHKLTSKKVPGIA